MEIISCLGSGDGGLSQIAQITSSLVDSLGKSSNGVFNLLFVHSGHIDSVCDNGLSFNYGIKGSLKSGNLGFQDSDIVIFGFDESQKLSNSSVSSSLSFEKERPFEIGLGEFRGKVDGNVDCGSGGGGLDGSS
mgnify:CR=1 FL=1